jgi:hypothetical protein
MIDSSLGDLCELDEDEVATRVYCPHTRTPVLARVNAYRRCFMAFMTGEDQCAYWNDFASIKRQTAHDRLL